jgi:hypothetical protein
MFTRLLNGFESILANQSIISPEAAFTVVDALDHLTAPTSQQANDLLIVAGQLANRTEVIDEALGDALLSLVAKAIAGLTTAGQGG